MVSGLLFSVMAALVKTSGIAAISFDGKLMTDFCQNIFFMCVGYSFSSAMARKAGGSLVVRIGLLVIALTTLQDLTGVAVGKIIGMNPLLALQCSSAAMSGGVGTAAAFGPVFEGMGAIGATTVGVAAATLGNIMGSLIGGPVGVSLIKKYNLKSDPADQEQTEKDGKVALLSNGRMVTAFAFALLLTALGMPFFAILKNIPHFSMPKFIGCLFAGAIGRNLFEATGRDTYIDEMNAIEHMFLELYLALVLMRIDITALKPVAGQMSLVLVAQAILMAAFAYFLTFRVLGKNYGAAVMAAGNCGWGCGAGPNALANEKAVMDVYGWHTVAWVVYPSLCLIINNIYNTTLLSIMGNIFGK